MRDSDGAPHADTLRAAAPAGAGLAVDAAAGRTAGPTAGGAASAATGTATTVDASAVAVTDAIADAAAIADFPNWLRGLQRRIVAALEDVEAANTPQPVRPATFHVDAWHKAPHEPLQGEGVTCILEGGAVFERAGCGFSHVRGARLPPAATAHRPQLNGAPFEAMGVSLVFHPRNPYVPTVHMNVRMLAAQPAGGAPVCWFGGGMDLTPVYGFEDDCVHFHAACRDALAPFGAEHHPRFKAWCDTYFFLRHRGEARGVGGIFFDDFDALGTAGSAALTRAVGDAFLPAYLPLVERRLATPYGERERDFQRYRRGRYVEFNLVWDRGTHFGLQSGGRTESILLSMPPLAAWRYDWQPAPGSPEAALAERFLPPRAWV